MGYRSFAEVQQEIEDIKKLGKKLEELFLKLNEFEETEDEGCMMQLFSLVEKYEASLEACEEKYNK